MTRPKFRPCPSCQTPNQASRKTCHVCFGSLSTKNKIKEKVASLDSQWGKSVLKSRNAGRIIDSARIAVLKLEAVGYKPILFIGKQDKRASDKWVADIITHLHPTPVTKVFLEKMRRAYEFILTKAAGERRRGAAGERASPRSTRSSRRESVAAEQPERERPRGAPGERPRGAPGERRRGAPGERPRGAAGERRRGAAGERASPRSTRRATLWSTRRASPRSGRRASPQSGRRASPRSSRRESVPAEHPESDAVEHPESVPAERPESVAAEQPERERPRRAAGERRRGAAGERASPRSSRRASPSSLKLYLFSILFLCLARSLQPLSVLLPLLLLQLFFPHFLPLFHLNCGRGKEG
ncbi:histone H1-II-like isoform X1 [Carassius auratus]|uniref:Histone H1-II-like isoform X1 n=1 Tax=Carassius auratus TaxID=7957 RepID=A0A6P6JHM4_CARAU|nr:histone H1-II-like isoform X1 [Carassius auratus]XP_026059152.1 histone H1-II-like isoform X1 [Carassius auratus]